MRISTRQLFCACIVLLAALAAMPVRAQLTVSGYVEDALTTERLIGASVYAPALGTGTTTDAYGYFVLSVPTDTVTLQFGYVGYVLAKAAYDASPPVPVRIALRAGAELATVSVSEARSSTAIDERILGSTVDIPMAQYRTAPVLLGEPDLLKTLQLMPGVQGGVEGTAGLYVRGGSPDQNLILFDGVPIYNVSHALGIFSVFNGDAVQDVSLTKGGFPARFGGRLSSVLEVEMKDGPGDRWRAEGGVGLTSARATVGGPVGDNTRVLVSARATYFDVIYGAIQLTRDPGGPEKSLLRANFYDTYLKVRHDLNTRHRLYLSNYLGGDRFANGYEGPGFSGGYAYYREGVRWGTQLSALRWRYQVAPRLFVNTIASRTRYAISNDYRSESRLEAASVNDLDAADYGSAIRDYALRADLTYAPEARHTLRGGLQATRHRYQTGTLREQRRTEGVSLDTTFRDDTVDATEFAAYLEHEWTRSPKLALNYGLHASAFASDATFASLQPRLSIRYKLPRDVAVKASYAEMTQFVNLLTTESLALPTDLWVPSMARVQPQRSWQAAVGLVKQLARGPELSAEAFYKSLDGVVSYRAGESFFEFDPQRSWQDKVTQGRGTVYGLELLAQQKVGATTGWVGYTYSRNDRTFAELNGGRAFPFRYDRRHDLSLLASHRFSKRITLSGSWVFFTGNAYTLPQYRQYTNAEVADVDFEPSPDVLRIGVIPQASARNQFRVSDSHRLDLSITLTKSKKWGERTWVFGVYNAYWHKNPVYVRARDVAVRDPNTQEVIGTKRQFEEVSLLPIVPSASYQFRFDL